MEIREVTDYTKDVPQNIPNDEWDLYGENFELKRDSDAYPIKTYEKFFEPQGEKISAEEKRIDPINSLMEALSKLGPGEQYWLQFIFAGAHDYDEPEWKKEGKSILDKLAGRSEKKPVTFLQELMLVLRNVVLGPEKEGSGEKATYKWATSSEDETVGDREMVLSPLEREIMTEVENKMKKPAFRTTLRGVYLSKRENWNSSHKTLARSYFGHFSSNYLNYLSFASLSRTKVTDIFRKRRVFYRSRRMIRNAVLRFPPLFPDRKKDSSILSTEELATLFHFPFKISATNFPSVQRVEHRKAGPPTNLPIE